MQKIEKQTTVTVKIVADDCHSASHHEIQLVFKAAIESACQDGMQSICLTYQGLKNHKTTKKSNLDIATLLLPGG